MAYNDYTNINTNVHRINYEFNRAVSSSDLNITQSIINNNIATYLINNKGTNYFRSRSVNSQIILNGSNVSLEIPEFKFILINNNAMYCFRSFLSNLLKISLGSITSIPVNGWNIYCHYRDVYFTYQSGNVYINGLRNNSYNTFNIESNPTYDSTKIIDSNLNEEVTSRNVIELTFYASASATPQVLGNNWSNGQLIGNVIEKSPGTLIFNQENPIVDFDTVTSHINELVNSESGIHGFRFYNNKLQYYNGTWIDISLGQTDINNLYALINALDIDLTALETKVDNHIAKTSSDNVHGLTVNNDNRLVVNGTVIANLDDITNDVRWGDKILPEGEFVSDWIVEPISGSGTQSDPYLIFHPYHLTLIKNNLTAYYKLVNNIDLGSAIGMVANIDYTDWNLSLDNPSAPLYNSGNGWEGLSLNGRFEGVFDGNGKKIKNILTRYNLTSASFSVLFNDLGVGGVIKNLILDKGLVDCRNTILNLGYGSFTRYAYYNSLIENCSNHINFIGSLVTTGSIGGIVSSGDCSILNCSNHGNLIANSTSIAGIITYSNVSGTGNPQLIENCYNTGNIISYNTTASSRPSGIMSSANVILVPVNIVNCYNVGLVAIDINQDGSVLTPTLGIFHYVNSNNNNNFSITNCFSSIGSSTSDTNNPQRWTMLNEVDMQSQEFVNQLNPTIFKFNEEVNNNFPFLNFEFTIINIDNLPIIVGNKNEGTIYESNYKLSDIITTVSNPNLLENSDFRIAQRGTTLTGVTSLTMRCLADRWQSMEFRGNISPYPANNYYKRQRVLDRGLHLFQTSTSTGTPILENPSAMTQLQQHPILLRQWDETTVRNIESRFSIHAPITMTVKYHPYDINYSDLIYDDNEESSYYIQSFTSTIHEATLWSPGSFSVWDILDKCGHGLDWTNSNNKNFWCIRNGKFSIKAFTGMVISQVKLEMGNKFTGFIPTNRGVEALKCYRFYVHQTPQAILQGLKIQGQNVTSFVNEIGLYPVMAFMPTGSFSVLETVNITISGINSFNPNMIRRTNIQPAIASEYFLQIGVWNGVDCENYTTS
jgi:hypothetical protein